ncbi:hypothetical protein IC614_03835 [Allosphingosinicella flava]|uniref:Uncharacterized protein n=1 Tax=Allosphingosinicella flava TaxID=2771430 RepID=A0A7T2LN17_9SPHN|nr:hypothetical protein [Sphingosinicella flava]QPQ55732.1 hypothetical protein IC614_03835 [Sphingosinicella flava]
MRSRRKSLALYATALIFGGTLLGVQFGRSAVAEIDPGFYRMWDDYHSFAQYSAAHDGQYPGEEAGLSVQTAGCDGCELGTGRFPWLQHPVFSDAELGIAESVPVETAAYVADDYAVMPAEPEPLPQRSLARYAYYPVDATDPPAQEERPEAVAVADQTAAPACGPDDLCQPVGM